MSDEVPLETEENFRPGQRSATSRFSPLGGTQPKPTRWDSCCLTNSVISSKDTKFQKQDERYNPDVFGTFTI
jgi:hypothetical protein